MMKYLDELYDPALLARVAAEIGRTVGSGRRYRIMDACGGHTHAIYRHGLAEALSANVEFVHGPGCPVCVVPAGRVGDGLSLAGSPGITLACFGDMLRLPGPLGTPLELKARGADIRMVCSPLDALRLAQGDPDRHVCFFALGFETTAPSTALTLARAKALGVRNFSVFCNHLSLSRALRAVAESPALQLDGFIGPGHVSTIVGCAPYEFIARHHGKPFVIAGFAPLDILEAVLMLVRQLSSGVAKVENQYRRSVPATGNAVALRAMDDAFVLRPSFEWRGLGSIPDSAFALAPAYADWDAELRFSLPRLRVTDPPGTRCGDVLRGALNPPQCELFGEVCRPARPVGVLMASSDTACTAYYRYVDPGER